MKNYRIYEVAVLLGLHPFTVRRFIHEGKLSASYEALGRGYRISESDLLTFLSKNPSYEICGGHIERPYDSIRTNEFCTVRELANTLCIRPETVYKWIRSDILDADMDSRKNGYYISQDALIEMMQNNPEYYSVLLKATGNILHKPISDRVDKNAIIEYMNSVIAEKEEELSVLTSEIEKMIDSLQEQKKILTELKKIVAMLGGTIK